ncbi:MAG: hypothetical protein PHP57_12485 [Sideroxydans sp.]|nr:hypothetical protein [Sideroxydans sp.]
MFTKKLIVVSIIGALTVANANAVGLGDLVGIGLQVGGKVVGAGVDKVSDSMRDPEAEAAKKRAEERQAAENFKRITDEIETKPGLRPIQREKLILTLKKQRQWAEQMQSLSAQSEAKQKEERDKIFTTSGFLGVVGSAATGVAASQATVQLAANDPNALKNIDRAVDAKNQAVTAYAVGVAIDDAKQAGTASAASATTTQQSSGDPAAIPVTPDAFSMDMGKAIYIEFVGSPSRTERLKKLLSERGHRVVDSKEQAEVNYLVEGEYWIPETKLHDGYSRDLGNLLETSVALPVPEKKLSGSIGRGIGVFMLTMAKAQGQQVPDVPASKDGVYEQRTLLVIARQPKIGKEARYSVLKEVDSGTIDGAVMSKNAVGDMFDNLGLNGFETN